MSMGLSRQEYWSGLPLPPAGDLPDPGIKPVAPALAGGFFTAEPPRFYSPNLAQVTSSRPRLSKNENWPHPSSFPISYLYPKSKQLIFLSGSSRLRFILKQATIKEALA